VQISSARSVQFTSAADTLECPVPGRSGHGTKDRRNAVFFPRTFSPRVD
jgi:hypothetical protein